MQTMKSVSPGAPYKVPKEQDSWRSLALAAAMHAGLIFFLWVGVHWQSNAPVAVEAEVWDMKVQEAAPPAPTPPPQPEAQEEVKPPPPAPPVEDTPPVQKEPDIALERQKAKLKLEEKKLEEAKQAELKREADDKLAKLKKAEADKKLAEEKAEQEKKDLADKQKKLDAAKLAKAKAAEQKKVDQIRAAEMSRLTAAVGSGTVGTAAKSTGPRGDAGYQAAIQAKIRGNLVYSTSDDTLTATFKITQLPTGEVIAVRKVKSSGVAAYDSAIENAISKSSYLPKKKDGTVERELILDFNMKDLH